ncbi:MAG TPA: queuosine precursor transporter [Patescibacteria group bacterium]|nr:queuosine precursor transporter [Patescibacteria group bacterium]
MFKIEKLDLLVSVYIFCICASELMGAKSFPFFKLFGYQFTSTVAILILPLIYTINDVIAEVFGKERARSMVRSGLVVVFLILIFSLISTSLPPSKRFLSSEAHYEAVFGLSARISAASLIAFIISEFTDIAVFMKMKEKFGKKALWLRNNLSNFVSEGLDTLVFMTLAFYAFNQSFESNASFLIGLILPYWFLKCFMSVIETPFVYLGVRWLGKKSIKN